MKSKKSKKPFKIKKTLKNGLWRINRYILISMNYCLWLYIWISIHSLIRKRMNQLITWRNHSKLLFEMYFFTNSLYLLVFQFVVSFWTMHLLRSNKHYWRQQVWPFHSILILRLEPVHIFGHSLINFLLKSIVSMIVLTLFVSLRKSIVEWLCPLWKW